MKSFSNLKNRVNNTISGTDRQKEQAGAEDDQSLATLLTRDQRAELSVLMSQTTEEMRKSLVRGFDERPKPKPKPQTGTEDMEKEMAELKLSQQDMHEQPKPEAQLEEKQSQNEPEPSEEPDTLLTSATPESKMLKQAALTFFDAWAEA